MTPHLDCIDPERLQEIIFEGEEISPAENEHLFICPSCLEAGRELEQVGEMLRIQAAEVCNPQFDDLLRARTIARNLTVVCTRERERWEFLARWGAVAAAILLILLPASGIWNTDLGVVPDKVFGYVNGLTGTMLASLPVFSGATVTAFLAALAVVASDLLPFSANSPASRH